MQSHWHQEEDRDDHSSHSFQHCAQITSWSSKAWEGKQCIHIPILFFLVNCFRRSLALPGLCFLIIWTQDRKLKQTKLASFLYLALSYQEVEKTCGLDSIELLCSSWGKWVNINPLFSNSVNLQSDFTTWVFTTFVSTCDVRSAKCERAGRCLAHTQSLLLWPNSTKDFSKERNALFSDLNRFASWIFLIIE